MPEIAQFLIGSAVLFAVGVLCFMGGRDAAERRAYSTIADLRHQLRAQTLETVRLRERLNTIPRGDAQRLTRVWP